MRTSSQAESLRVLVVDDDVANLRSVEKILHREGLEVVAVDSGSEAARIMREGHISVLLTDLMMPGVDGMELLRIAGNSSSHTAVILMTAYGTVETAVAAMKEGAYDFVTKPLRRAEVVRAVERARERANLRVENARLLRELERAGRSGQLVGSSPLMRQVLDMVQRVATARATVLLQGESGTGKEVIARALHRLSERKGNFIAVNCAAIPENLLESELFGHERGAFTGAVARRDGRFHLAHAGTLLLDEIGDLPLPLQGKLLRVLQESEVERVGGSGPESVDVRVVAATNRNLQEEVQAGRFRQDLFYRLNVIAIELPALRERGDDIPRLANHFMRRFSASNQKEIQRIDVDAMEALCAWSWPGNVRELENVIERAVVLARGAEITSEDLPANITGAEGDQRIMHIPVGTPLEEIERLALIETLRMTGGDKRRAANLLGVAVRTIYRKLDGLDRQDDTGGQSS